MQPPWFHVPDLARDLIPLPACEASHAQRSLRLRSGDHACLFDGQGNITEGVLESAAAVPKMKARRSAKSANLDLNVRISTRRTQPPPAPAFTLIVAACKGSRLDWLVEKATELGVHRFVLADFDRSVVRLESEHAVKLQRTALEACKQCGRAWLPEIAAGTPLRDALAEHANVDLVLADPSPAAQPLAALLGARETRGKAGAIVIGPEGGLTDEEIHWLRTRGAAPVSLGRHVLRIETAAIAAAAIWMCTAGQAN